MIIRCPQCSHSRSISESKIPPTAELATCPKCKQRFRFRTLPIRLDEPPASPAGQGKGTDLPAPGAAVPAREVLRPQSAFREAAGREDIWNAVEALNHRWQKQMDQHVVEVSTPLPAAEKQPASPAQTPPEEFEAAAPLPAPAAASAPSVPESPPETAAKAPPHVTPAMPEPLQYAAPDPTAAPAPNVTAAHGADAAPAAEAPHETPAAAEPAHGTAEATAPRRVPFLYSQDGPAPEERVEQDMQMLQAAPAERPTRDLGRLKEFPEGESEANAADPPDEDAGAWEKPSRLGLFKSFFATAKSVMFQGPVFFSRLDGSGSLAYSYLFLLAIGYICLLSVFLWSLAASRLLADVPPLIAPGMLPAALLLTPPALGGVVLFLTAATRLVLLVCAPDKADFGTVFKILCYASAPFILGVVPVVGVPLGAAWSLAALATGCRYGLRTSWPLAVCAPLPPALCVLAGAVFVFL